ncbi:MAG: peptidoglycan recognition family protein [Chloroflexota bacterium]
MKPVVTVDTGRDITEIVRLAADRHGFDPIGFIAGAIAESDLNEHATREQAWPDVSYGLWQPAVAFLGEEVAGLTRGPNGAALDTANNRKKAKQFCFDAALLTEYVAPRYARLLQKHGSALEAWCRWNLPSVPGANNPNLPNYKRGIAAAEKFRDSDGGVTAAVVPEPNFIFIGADSSNFSVGRGGIKPEAVVLHIAEGSMGSVDSWFNQVHLPPAGPSSAHFCVGKDGTVHQYVNTGNTAFANGIVEPGFTASLINDNGGINPNRWTISIEHEGSSGDAVPEAQLQASTQLTAWLFQNRLLNSGASGVAVDRNHVLKHGDISPISRKRCPGWSEAFIGQYIAQVRTLLGM